MSVSAAHPPGLALGEAQVALWTDFVVIVCDLATAKSVEWGVGANECLMVVQDVYFLGEHWAIVGELGVSSWSLDFTQRFGRYCHNEVAVGSMWEGDVLTVKDLAAGEFRLKGKVLERV